VLRGAVDLRLAPAPHAVEDDAHAHATAHHEAQRVLQHALAAAPRRLRLRLRREHVGQRRRTDAGRLRRAVELDAAAAAGFPELGEHLGKAHGEVIRHDAGRADRVDGAQEVAAALFGGGESGCEVGVEEF